jgi:predicted ATPase/DNA-binding SARP family transcriptional activator
VIGDGASLRFETLGPLRVTANDQVLPLGPPLQRALLAALLIDAGQTVQVPVLLDRLWGDEPPGTAVKSIQKYVSNLRRLFGPSRILSEGGYRLVADHDEIDEIRFERALGGVGLPDGDPEHRLASLERSLDLWRGEPYADLSEHLFLEPVRARLREARGSMIEERLSLLVELGRLDEVVSETRQLVDTHPFRERLWQLRMTALAGVGRPAEALAEFQRLRGVLGEELGLEPSGETVELEEKILLQDPALVPTHSGGNLPARVASIVARASEIERLETLLASSRLVTVVGSAGVGKTTLTMEVARRMAPRFAHGGWLVGLGPITEEDRVPGRIAESLGIIEPSGGDLTSAVIGFLQGRQALVVLDNCEHVIDGVAALVSQLLTRAPDVTIMATSRQTLNLAGESVLGLQGLDYPPPGTPADEGMGFPAVQLLIDRAKQTGASLEIGEDWTLALAGIARLLDGVPLALELAASRLRFISPSDLLRQLTTHMTPLVSERRDLPDRQRTLGAAIDWSFQLLQEEERTMLARLTVFRGGFTVEAMRQVAGWDLSAPTSALEALVRHSLVTIAPPAGGGHRYQLLWVIRLFAQSRLDDERVVRERHADYYLQLVEPTDPKPLHAPVRDLTEMLAESENLRAALKFWMETGDAERGLRMAAALGSFWLRAGSLSEGRDWLNHFLADTSSSSGAVRVRALMALADAYDPASSDLALTTSRRALAAANETGDKSLIAAASALVGRTHALRRERELAIPLIEDALAYFEATNDVIGMAQSHEALGVVHRGSEQDLYHYRRSVELYRIGGAEVDLAQTLFSMAYRSLIPRGDLEQAHIALAESAILAQRLGSPQIYAHARSGLGQLRRLEGRLDEAAEIMSEVLVSMREFGDRRCIVRMLTALSRIDLVNWELNRAKSRLEEATRVGVELDEGLSSDTHELVDALGYLALSRGEFPTAARWLGAAESIRTSQVLIRSPADQVVFQDAMNLLEHELGRPHLEKLVEEGSRLSLADLAVELTP